MSNTLIAIAALIIFIVIVIWLQIFLSKRENKWVGLLLPLITFAFSVVAVLGIAAYSSSDTSLELIEEGGQAVNIIVENETLTPIMDIPSVIALSVITLVLYNIPTAILLAIYIGCREKRKKNAGIRKMNLHDLD